MQFLMNIAVIVQVVAAVAVIGLVLLQHGKGADMGAAFGAGASGSLFGASGSANFLSRSTAVAATVFFCATLAVTIGSGVYQKHARADRGGVLGTIEQTEQAPAAGAGAAPGADPGAAPEKKDDLQSNQIPR